MIREMMRVMAGRPNLGTTARRTRRFQPGLGLGAEGLEMRLALSGMGMEMGPTEPGPSNPPSNDSTNVTVTNQDDDGASPTSDTDSNRTSLGG